MATQASLDLAQTLYVAYYGRPADRAGLNYWAEEIDANGVDAMVNAFGTSAEFEARFGSLSNDQLINNLYQQMFGRSAELAGLDFYTQQLANGESTLAEIALDIANGAQNEDATALENKVAVAADFTAAIDTTEEVLAYSGNDAANAARDFIATVDANTDVAAVDVDAQLAQLVANDEQNPGETFSLTTGADDVTGTDGNDTFTATTVNGLGTGATTLQTFDSIDGEGGTDTLNVYVDTTNSYNDVQAGSVSNVEVINLISDSVDDNANDGTAGIDASQYDGATQVWAVNGIEATAIKNVDTGVTAGFRNLATSDDDIVIDMTATAASAAVALDDVSDEATLDINDDGATNNDSTKLASLSVSATDLKDTSKDGIDAIDTTVYAGDNLKTFAVDTDAALDLTVVDGTSTIKTLDATASTGGITYATNATVTAVNTGSGRDSVTLGVNLAAASSVLTADGNDTVDLAGFDVAKTAEINLGAGDDKLIDTNGTSVVDKAAVIDGGEGEDTLALGLVGAANVAAFANFEVFDVANLSNDLDLNILETANDVAKITGSGALGSASELQNVGEGVGFEIVGNMAATALTLTQEAASALTITSNVDEVNADSAADTSTATFVASNATSLNLVFDNDNVDTLEDGFANTAEIAVTAGTSGATPKGATEINIVSGGTEVVNTATITGAEDTDTSEDILNTVTITGDQDLVLDYTAQAASSVETVDASELTGGLTADLTELKSTANVTLGSGDDDITVGTLNSSTITSADLATITDFAMGTAEDAAEQDDFDVLSIANAAQAADATYTEFSVEDGLVTWLGAGPATLDEAAGFLDANLAVNETVVFDMGGSDYFVYGAGAAVSNQSDDVMVKLAGVTGVSGLDTDTTNGDVYIF
ncbi:DUF4214 domain-containing protein [Vreelandella salicampi]|uniref:DUF4214 domain-containing protein n=1 Tax=Vreelandella salicampi TaxID=1449798 RepID=A0A7Z0LJX4_9GAMM|nr:DUF4214 domain-containing protein [Halomonas salicampi]NYS60356.1 DUF4214 domain-containing protein [Halomonas salicampi]